MTHISCAVEESVDRGGSARSADRVELQRMLERIEDFGDVDYVFVHKIDRLVRDRRDDVEIAFRLRQAASITAVCMKGVLETSQRPFLET